MNLESQVCSLELAERLKELGIKQNSQFYFCLVKSIADHILKNGFYSIAHISQISGLPKDNFSAFTSAELGEKLPIIIKDMELICLFAKINCACGYGQYGEFDFYETGETEADARAKMLIYLLENNLMELPK